MTGTQHFAICQNRFEYRMKILGLIPARYASTRFPGKPLADIAGKSMIQRVYEQATAAQLLDAVAVATDDERIAAEVQRFGGKVVMTAADHPSGTDRCQEARLRIGGAFDYVLNIQGDEPFVQPEQIDLLAATLDGQTELATLIMRITQAEDLWNMGEVKVVLNTQAEALYFSRQPIPYSKKPQEEWLNHYPYYKHVGMYAYRCDVLEAITQLAPSPLELAESLEQLRWMEHGYKVKVAITTQDSVCIDTPEDLERALRRMNLQ